MKIHDDDYVLGIWYAQLNDCGDWMCIVRKPLDSDWEAEYRFKYYNDPDNKNTYTFKIIKTMPEKAVIDKINRFFEMIKSKYSDFSDHVEIKGGVDKLYHTVKEISWLDMFTQQ